jgi:hypothetical protein
MPLQLRRSAEGGPLGRQLAECAKRIRGAGDYDAAAARRQIREIISKFVIRD